MTTSFEQLSPRSRRRRAVGKETGFHSWTENADWWLLGSVLGLIALGFVMIYSSSRSIVIDDPLYFVKRQSVALIVSLGVFFLIMRIDYRRFSTYSLVAYLGTCIALFLVLTPFGSDSRGAQAWFQLPFGFQLQPSEFAKVILIIALAGFVNQHRDEIDPWRLTLIVGVALIPLALVQLQPDLGTNMVLLSMVIGLLAVAGVKGRYLLILMMLAITGVFVVLNLGILKQYQLDRLTVVLDGGSRKEGASYNQDQSKKTIATGGLTGQGLFKGPQTRLGFVPEQQTDFIFTAAGEEFGFAGTSLILTLFAIVMWRTWRIANLSADFYGTLICSGVLAVFVFMIFENIGMTMGIMPITGIPLPFMSYGGSSLITCVACIALVANVHANRFS